MILLSGLTGTGKTLTVESGEISSLTYSQTLLTPNSQVSDRAQSPVYHLRAGDIGQDAYTLRKELKNAFQLCSEWGCVLLLDGECLLKH